MTIAFLKEHKSEVLEKVFKQGDVLDWSCDSCLQILLDNGVAKQISKEEYNARIKKLSKK